MESCISINQKKDEIIIKINESAEQEEILKELNSKIKGLQKMYKEEKIPILIIGKILKNKETQEIEALIKRNINVEVEFDTPKILGLHGIKKVFEKEINSLEATFYRGSLRSGKKLEFEGSIIIIGDVNGGAEVVAGGNIIILGILRGIAHAGANGNKKAIIAANAIDTPQLRIANVVKEIEKEEMQRRQSYIYLEGEEIIIE